MHILHTAQWSVYHAESIKFHSFIHSVCEWNKRVKKCLNIKNSNLISISKSMLLICVRYAYITCIVEMNDHKRNYSKGKHEKIMDHSSILYTVFLYHIIFNGLALRENHFDEKEWREKWLKELLQFFFYLNVLSWGLLFCIKDIKLTLCTQRMAYIMWWFTLSEWKFLIFCYGIDS